MRFGILFVYEVSVVGSNHLHTVFLADFDNLFVDTLLFRKSRLVGIGAVGFVALNFEVKIVAENVFKPFNRFFCSVHVAIVYFPRYLTPQASRGDDESFVILLKQFLVDARTVIKPFGPAFRYHLDEVFVSGQVFGKHNKMPATAVNFFRL
ncbi:hypothetical protein SDC9_179204 [bioreactor metagenome]|uniref:Uncharacterized protein n=1 Tax=bioreactor metagenome TaxID=1076179 RepID=A0A645GZ97_9ZZZZ